MVLVCYAKSLGKINRSLLAYLLTYAKNMLNISHCLCSEQGENIWNSLQMVCRLTIIATELSGSVFKSCPVCQLFDTIMKGNTIL